MITVVGSINLDLITTMDRLPAPGETVGGKDFHTAPGGKGANQALAAARAGAAVRMVGAVGKDAFAGEAVALLRTGGIDLSRVAEVHAATGIAAIYVAGDGENMIAVAPGANFAVTKGSIAGLKFAAGEHVLLQNEIPIDTTQAVLDQAREQGAISMLNTAPFVAAAAALLGRADYAVANETEFDLFADALGLPPGGREARMRAYVEQTGHTIVVTLGADGVLAATPDDFLKVDALKIVPVDTVGAGDTFCGYLGAGLAAGMTLGEALRRAAVAASLACLKPGAQPAIPLAADVDTALAG